LDITDSKKPTGKKEGGKGGGRKKKGKKGGENTQNPKDFVTLSNNFTRNTLPRGEGKKRRKRIRGGRVWTRKADKKVGECFTRTVGPHWERKKKRTEEMGEMEWFFHFFPLGERRNKRGEGRKKKKGKKAQPRRITKTEFPCATKKKGK